jgi:sugar porter (SP) family MFS transporter
MSMALQTVGGTRVVVGSSGVAALGGLLFGYDTGIISAALLFITREFGLSAVGQQVVVGSLLLGAVLGVLIGGPVGDAIGRRRALLGAAVLFAVAAVASAMATSAATLVGARLALGIALGSSSLIAPAYIAEISPAAVRGRLVSLNQLMITVGILVAYLVGYAFAGGQEWRWMLGLGTVPAVAMFAGLLALSESPRWLLTSGHPKRARAALERFHTAESADREIEEIRRAADQDARLSARDLLRPRLRPAVLLGVVIAATNQLVGVNAVIYYAPTMLQQAGFGDASAILATVGIGAVNVVVTVAALTLIDRLGRRKLILGGTTVVIAALLLLGTLYLVTDLGGPARVLLVLGLCLYIAAFAASLGIAIWLINSEIFPTAVRAKAAALGTGTHWVLNLAISSTVLTTISALTPTGLFWLYAAFGLAGLWYLARRLPETRDRSLEDVSAELRG